VIRPRLSVDALGQLPVKGSFHNSLSKTLEQTRAPFRLLRATVDREVAYARPHKATDEGGCSDADSGAIPIQSEAPWCNARLVGSTART
jgi:hypothetical protein